MSRAVLLLGWLSGCTMVVVDEPCDTAEVGLPDRDTGPSAPNRFIDVGTGAAHTCGLRPSGAIDCWGANDEGQLDAPAGVFASLHIGHAHGCALNDAGDVTCWGRNDRNQASLSGRFSAIALGGAHSCGLTDEGTVVCIGSNEEGQLDSPTLPMTALVAGATHTCGLLAPEEGEQPRSVCWGSISKEPGRTEHHTAMIAGTDWSCFAETDNDGIESTVCLGANEHGQHDVPAGASIAAATAGARHGCAVTSGGTIECWGANDAQQRLAPQGLFQRVISGPTSLHTCALEASNDAPEAGTAVHCWGLNAENQLEP
ncbi:MAG: hypothetical protein VX127_02580 [Myxococcota bacterium]|nr:hypothetical protein [Myxococcota bacterium]